MLVLMRKCRNFFNFSAEDGEFELVDGNIVLGESYKVGQYLLMTGSILVDGVYQIIAKDDYPCEHDNWLDDDGDDDDYDNGLAEPYVECDCPQKYIYTLDNAPIDEKWTGIIHGLNVPADFVRLTHEIHEFNKSEAGKMAHSPYVSETVLNVHSYKLAQGKEGLPLNWRDLYKTDLAPYHRMFTEVSI